MKSDKGISVGKKISKILKKIRQEKPLIHNITNMVAMNDTANIILAIGALPIMAHAQEEVGEMVKAAGATNLRTESALSLQEKVKINIVRGNFAEISILAGFKGNIKGVESVGSEKNSVEIAYSLARKYNQVAIITGKKDIVTDGKRVVEIDNGSPMLRTITATGCMATSLIASFAAVCDDYVLASTGALVCFGLAGERATLKAKGPGTFKANLFDEIYNLDKEIICRGLRVNIYEL